MVQKAQACAWLAEAGWLRKGGMLRSAKDGGLWCREACTAHRAACAMQAGRSSHLGDQRDRTFRLLHIIARC